MRDNDLLPPAFHAAIAQSRVMNVGYVADATRRVAALDEEQRARVCTNIVALANVPATSDGVATALALLDEQARALPSTSARSGASPSHAAMLAAGMPIVHALVAKVATAENAAALLQLTSGLDDHDRLLIEQEVQLAVGRAAFIKARAANA